MESCISKNAFKFWNNEKNTFKEVKNNISISTVFDSSVDDNIVYFIASSPPDKNTSFSGSGYPFASMSQALEQTSNKGIVKLESGNKANIIVESPNSFYIHSHLIYPTVFLKYKKNGEEKYKALRIGNKLPYRSLYHPNERYENGPMFYKDLKDYPVLSQEQIFYNSSYNTSVNNEENDFWGLKPSQ